MSLHISRVRSIIVILLNCNIFVILLFVTMPAFLSGFCIGTISNFVWTAKWKPHEKSIHRAKATWKKYCRKQETHDRFQQVQESWMEKVSTMLNNTVEIYHFSIIWKSSPRDSHQVGPVKNRSAYPRHKFYPSASERKFDRMGPGEAGFSEENFLSWLPG